VVEAIQKYIFDRYYRLNLKLLYFLNPICLLETHYLFGRLQQWAQTRGQREGQIRLSKHFLKNRNEFFILLLYF
jgi:hypothetical protein